MEDLLSDFINKLKKIFGHYDADHHRFEKASNSEIARELGYSDAQFSRLINGSATEGEYQRANQNIDRIILLDKQAKEIDKYKSGKEESNLKKALPIISGILAILLVILSALYIFRTPKREIIEVKNKADRATTLKWAFETSYVKPYINLDDLPNDCNYPCYKYQGKWTLDASYKIPFFREQNGYHYLAKEVIMYARCMSEESATGDRFEGYEYQKHEIWYDKRELPIDSFIDEKGHIKNAYREMKLNENENFILVAYVHTFFRNEFTLIDSLIKRTGKVIGRDVELVPDKNLLASINDESKVKRIKNSISRIANNRLEDFSKPISCNMAQAPSKDFHHIKDGDIMDFSCELTTSRVALAYDKKYILEDQYIKNTCRSSIE